MSRVEEQSVTTMMDGEYPVEVSHEYVDGVVEVGPGITQLLDLAVERAHDLGAPPFNVKVIFSGDVTRSVRERGEEEFGIERVGGIVVGKTLPLHNDYSQTEIIVDVGLFAPDDGPSRVLAFEVLLHEYGHALIGRLRAAAGTKPPVAKHRSQTLEEVGVHLACEAGDEYRCERFAHSLLRPRLRATVDGVDVPASHLFAPLAKPMVEEFGRILDEVIHPGLADLVQRYRIGEIGLDDLYWQLGAQIVGVFKLLARAEATSAASGVESVLATYSGHPGLDLYLRDAWCRLHDLLVSDDPIPPASEFGQADRELQSAGSGIVDMWARLGVRGELTPDDNLYLHVEEPLR